MIKRSKWNEVPYSLILAFLQNQISQEKPTFQKSLRQSK